MIGGYFFIATAVCAQRFTKGEMQVNTNATAFILRLKLLLKSSCPLLYGYMVVPKRNRWVTGITGNGHIVFMQQSGINDHVNGIDAKLSVRLHGLADLL
jgi:hypothetical protein